MFAKLGNVRLMVAIGLSLALVAAVACSADEDEPAPAPAPAPPPAAPAPAPAPAPTEEAMMGPDVMPGFTRVTAAKIGPVIPPEVDASQLEPVQQSSYVYNHGTPKTGTAPFYEGGGHRAWNKWVFMTPFLFTPDFGDHYSEGVLREGVAWAYDVSDHGKTYILHLNPETHFTDGGPVTAQDVKDAWEFGAWPDNQVAWGAILLHTGAIVGMDAVESGETLSASGLTALDDHTLQIELKEKDPTWHLQMSMWMLGIFDPEYAKANEDWEEHPVGVGAYNVVLDINTGNQELIAAENPWLAEPRIRQWVMPQVPETQTSLIMYENAELDIIYADSTRQPAVYDPNHPLHGDLKEKGSAGLWYTAFDTTHPPFDELEMRKAFAHGADWNTIMPAVFGASEEWAAGIIQKGVPCYRPDTGYDFDPDFARSQLAASSYGSAENVPTITVALGRPQWIRVFEISQEQWRDELVSRSTFSGASPASSLLRSLRYTAGASVPASSTRPASFATWACRLPVLFRAVPATTTPSLMPRSPRPAR